MEMVFHLTPVGTPMFGKSAHLLFGMCKNLHCDHHRGGDVPDDGKPRGFFLGIVRVADVFGSCQPEYL